MGPTLVLTPNERERRGLRRSPTQPHRPLSDVSSLRPVRSRPAAHGGTLDDLPRHVRPVDGGEG